MGGRQKWAQCGTDYNEAVRCRALKEQELLQEKREKFAKPDTTPKAPSSSEELRSAFLAVKRKEKRKDRTPLDPDTIRSHEQLTADFIHLTKCQYPADITGETLNNWMLTLEDGYTGKDSKVHKPAGPRTVYNLYTNIGCFLRFCGMEPNPNNKHSYGLRKLLGTNVPGKNDRDPEAFTEQEWTKFMSVIKDERDALAFETMVLAGPRE